jgi:hypothetical protein
MYVDVREKALQEYVLIYINPYTETPVYMFLCVMHLWIYSGRIKYIMSINNLHNTSQDAKHVQYGVPSSVVQCVKINSRTDPITVILLKPSIWDERD